MFFFLFTDSFSEIQGSSERHVNEGSQLSLFCSIIDISGPPSFVFWYRDGTVVNYSDQGSGVRIVTKTDEADFKISRKNLPEEEAVLVSSLYIDTVKPEDAGKYTCAPSNARNHSVVVHVIKGKNINTVFPQVVSAETILFWKLECGKYSWRKLLFSYFLETKTL